MLEKQARTETERKGSTIPTKTFNALGSNDQQLPTDYEYEQLPASRDWDADEIAAMQVDWSQPPRCNLVCFHHFCPEWAGEDTVRF